MMIDREKVARAILRADGSDISDTDDVAEYHLPAADAAIAAVLEQLREPTPRMLEAGRPRMHGVLRSADTVWRVMLNAAFPTRPESDTPAE